MYEVPNPIALNRTVRSRTKACTGKSSPEISALLRYYAELSGNSFPLCQDNPSVLYSRGRKSKRVTVAQMKLTDTIFFFGTSLLSNYLK
jgi:hypothetical protein